MKTSFTPGPWLLTTDLQDSRKIIVWNGVTYIATVDQAELKDGHITQTDVNIKNAHLIAAAPEMYEALVLIRRYAGSRDNEGFAGYAEGCRLADLALAKARGES